MDQGAKIYVAGHRGLAGSAIMRRLQQGGYRNLVTRTHAELDLTEQAQIRQFFAAERPEYVFLAAAKVGGILANSDYPADFIHANLAIQTNVIHEAYRSGVKRLLFLGSSCIYPRDCPQPIKETYLLTGPLEPTNRPYAIAKIAGVEMCWSYNRQFGTRFLAAMPTNLYGPGDNYDPKGSHVIPALIRKFHDAKRTGAAEVVVWGTGTPRREFLHSDDMADACVHLMRLPDDALAAVFDGRGAAPPLINVGAGSDVAISELAGLIGKIADYRGRIVFDPSKPDGTPKKLLDCSLLASLGWRAGRTLATGLAEVYGQYAAA